MNTREMHPDGRLPEPAPNPALARYVFGSAGEVEPASDEDDVVPGTDFP